MRGGSRRLKTFAALGLLMLLLGVTSIDPVRKYGWGENIGWLNWRDANGTIQGVEHHGAYLAGYIWGENVGWIDVGNGAAPYSNTDHTNYGVNVLANGDLAGLAWGENIGWVNFGTAPSLGGFGQQARWDSTAGRFRGYAWGENVGWINLDDPTHYVAVAQAAVMAWRSVRTHGAAVPQSIMMNATAGGNGIGGPTSEPRQGGIQRIEVDFNLPVTIANSGMITVTGRTTSPGGVLGPTIVYLPSSVISVSATTIAITFPAAPAPGHLPDQTCYTMTFGSGLTSPVLAGDLDVNVRSLLADTTGSGDITLSDAVAIRTRYGNALSSDARFDVDLSGAINSADAVLTKGRISSPSRKTLCP